jgi:hypothetical protein
MCEQVHRSDAVKMGLVSRGLLDQVSEDVVLRCMQRDPACHCAVMEDGRALP